MENIPISKERLHYLEYIEANHKQIIEHKIKYKTQILPEIKRGRTIVNGITVREMKMA